MQAGNRHDGQEQRHVHHPTGSRVDADRGRGARATDPGALEVPDVRRHRANARGGDPIRERGRELHHSRADEREGLGRCPHQ